MNNFVLRVVCDIACCWKICCCCYYIFCCCCCESTARISRTNFVSRF